MKITIATGIFWPEIGGPATYVKKLAEELIRQGFLVDVIARSDRSYEEDKKLLYKVYRVRNRSLKFLSYINYIFKLWRIARDSDVIYAQGAISSGFPAMMVNKYLKKRFVIKIVGDYAWETAQNTDKTVLGIDEFQKSEKSGKIQKLYELQSRVCKTADAVIAPSNYLAGLVNGWGVSEDKIKVIYNGTDFKPLDIEKEEARKRIGIAGNIILSVGRLVPWKGFKMLIKIMPQLIPSNQFLRLVIVGDGPDLNKLKSMIKNFKLEKKVFLVGRKSKDELANYLAASDLFILNTGYEGFSHQILEAMIAGVPIITTDVGGNKEIIRHGENAFVVNYNDEFDLVEAVKMLWGSEERKRRLAHQGRKTANIFKSEDMIEETIKILSK